MYRIGQFSKLSKTTIKALRFYEKKELLVPSFIDENGYRYYDASKLIDVAHIVFLRQIGFSIQEIKDLIKQKNFEEMLILKQKEIRKDLDENMIKLSKIQYLLGGRSMKYEVIVKELPEVIVYYKEGILKDYSCLGEFIVQSGKECLELNPDIKCIEPDYCFSEYLDRKYVEKNIKYRYSQAVNKMGNDSEFIKFKKLNKVKAVSLYHKGSYATLSEAYGFILDYIQKNNLEIIDNPRERYIDGIWNKDNEDDYLTEIQIPIK